MYKLRSSEEQVFEKCFIAVALPLVKQFRENFFEFKTSERCFFPHMHKCDSMRFAHHCCRHIFLSAYTNSFENA